MEKLSGEQLVKVLKKEGVEVTVDEAVLILKMLRQLAGITVAGYLKQNKDQNAIIDKPKSG